ncbi:MAG: MFS transporter [Chlorobi bacterium]|nr:MFS transporter [Chlorobiota bacterium]
MSARLPRGVIALGFVSLAMDLSSEMIHSLLPVFLVTVLGASAMSVGVIEGVAEAAVSVAKIFSGMISDWVGRRKPLVLFGYGLSALTKPLFPLATGIGTVLAARFLDRVGKGIRGAPRDALIADITPGPLRGAAYGLRQAMDTAGAFAGPLVAMVVMVMTHNDFHRVFWIAVIPAAVCVFLIMVGVDEPRLTRPQPLGRVLLSRADLARLPARYWQVVILAFMLTLARFSEAFLLLRAENVGVSLAWTPIVLIVMNAVYAVFAYPLGKLSDSWSRRGLLLLGISALIVADIVLATASDAWVVVIGAGLWGLHMSATEGLIAALIAETAPTSLRGTAFGLFHLVSGVALLLASTIAGGLWTLLGPAATFSAGAVFAAIAAIGLASRRLR